jgi:hypothetical protein
MFISVGSGGSQHGGAMVEKLRTVVIYESVSGRIVHTHHAVTFVGGKSLPNEDLQTRALKLARDNMLRRGQSVPPRLMAIHVDPATITRGVQYRVDPKRRSLVVIPSKSGRTKKVARVERTRSAKKSK